MNAGERLKRTPDETRRHLEESAKRMENRVRVGARIGQLVCDLYDEYDISPHDMSDILTELAKNQTSVR